MKYSLSDSEGHQLTKEQQEYFKDSKVRDENGSLKLMYHGGAYHGFQVQPSEVTVQGTLAACLEKAFGFPCKVTGCSRTDAGVHARGYCCTVEPAETDSTASS